MEDSVTDRSNDRSWSSTELGDRTAPVRHRAASILEDWLRLQRTGKDSLSIEVMSCMATGLENFPEICIRRMDRVAGEAFLSRECNRLLQWRDLGRLPQTLSTLPYDRFTSNEFHPASMWETLWLRIRFEGSYVPLGRPHPDLEAPSKEAKPGRNILRNTLWLCCTPLLLIAALLAFNNFHHEVTALGQKWEEHKIQQLSAQHSAPVLPVSDPDTFQEERDGDNTLSLEDVNGNSEIWEDTKSGTRLFCHGTSPCIKMPRLSSTSSKIQSSPKGVK